MIVTAAAYDISAPASPHTRHRRRSRRRSFYVSEVELHRLFKSINGLIFPVGVPPAGVVRVGRVQLPWATGCPPPPTHRALTRSPLAPPLQGGLTWLWLDSPYVLAARKFFNWAIEANNNGDVFPIHGTCLGFQLLHILASNVSRNDLLVDTDSVAHASTLKLTPEAEKR